MNDLDPTEHLWHHWPQAWYPVARVSGFTPGKVHNGHLCGREWVLYRGEDGVFRATDAFCPHMGAHLKSARVDGCSLECGLHGCLVDPAQQTDTELPPIGKGCRICAQAWHCIERFGLVWLHPPTAEPPPPPFDGNGHHWLTAGPRRICADWRAMICNGFDLSHMAMVHQRTVDGEPHFEPLPEGGLKMTYRTRILPKGGFSSWLMQRLSGGHIDLIHTCIGSSIMVQSRVGRFRTTGVFALLPENPAGHPPEQRSTQAFAAIGIPHGAPLHRLQLWIARFLYLAFLKKDFVVVEHMRLKLDGADDIGVKQAAAYQSSLKSM